MILKYTPSFEPTSAPDFELPGVDGKRWSLKKCMGTNGLVVMFICNHCPYVKSIQSRLVEDTAAMLKFGINCVAIMSNDVEGYQEDSFENMKLIARQKGYQFPYLLDETQQIAKDYQAVCTPDFFGLDKNAVIRYRGRLDAAGADGNAKGLKRDLLDAMREIAEFGEVKSEQIPSMGCSIKWKNNQY